MAQQTNIRKRVHKNEQVEGGSYEYVVPRKKKSLEKPLVRPPPKKPKLFDIEMRKKLVKKLLKDAKIPTISAIVNKLQPLPKDERCGSFTYCRVENDGNSLYRSLSYLLLGEESYHNYVRGVIFNFMNRYKKEMNELLKNSEYETVDSYLKETRADRYSRSPPGFIEVQAASAYFNVPIFLFTRPITIEPTVFSIRQEHDRGFVLFNIHGYFRPVLTFDGEALEHTEIALNSNKLNLISSNNFTVSIGVNELDALSTSLCKDAIKFNPMSTKLSESSLKVIEVFSKCLEPELDLDVKLFNFCCRYQCYSMIEFIIAFFKSQKSDRILQKLVDFIEGLEGKAKTYSEELVQHFSDGCLSATDVVLKSLSYKTDQIQKIVTNARNLKQNYTLATSYVNVVLSDNELAFKDVYPFTVLYFDHDKKKVYYFDGPRPENQNWVEIAMNRRLVEDLHKIASPDHILFNGNKVFVYNEMEESFGIIQNVFRYHEHLNYHVLPRSSKKLNSVHLVTSDKGECLLVDKTSKQVFDLFHRHWLKVVDIVVVEETDDYELCSISIKNTKSDQFNGSKRRVILRKPNSQSLLSFVDVFKSENIPKIPFQITTSRFVNTLTVKKRLADYRITLREQKTFEEQQQLMYKQVKPLIHYVVPRPKGDVIFALFDTYSLNCLIKQQRCTPNTELYMNEIADLTLDFDPIVEEVYREHLETMSTLPQLELNNFI